jgi:prophage regulatory protein
MNKPEASKLRLIRKQEVMSRLGLSHGTLYDQIKRGVLPRPLTIIPNGRAVAWVESEINAYVQGRIDAR